MAEAEDVLQDIARHATIYARSLWLRHRGPQNQPRPIVLAQVAERLDLLINAVFEQQHPFRTAQAPATPTMLTRLFRRHDVHNNGAPVPATDGRHIWLPVSTDATHLPTATTRFRAMALQQAMRAQRGSARLIAHTQGDPALRAVYILLEAQAADVELLRRLPGAGPDLQTLRQWMASRHLAQPPSLPDSCMPFQTLKMAMLQTPIQQAVPQLQAYLQLLDDSQAKLNFDPGGTHLPFCATPQESLLLAGKLATRLMAPFPGSRRPQRQALLHDAWTGDLFTPSPEPMQALNAPASDEQPGTKPPRGARMARRPKERKADKDEDKRGQGTWMVQTNPPLEKAEDPRGLQRPVDRDEDTPAEEFADALSELEEARLVSTPGAAKEVLLSDDPLEKRSMRKAGPLDSTARILHYPEWDYRQGGYRFPGAAVHLLPHQPGPQQWVDETLKQYQTVLEAIRKRFEALRAQRLWLRRQLDGSEIDLDAYIEGRADMRAGLPMPQALYRLQRPQSRDLAITLLIDISGSTDSWLAADKRIIDVEREALLLVCIALERLGAPYSIEAFSGEGPHHVTVTEVKAFNEPYSNDIALRIAALDAQHYTRAGAALRHATALLMKQQAQHRLLLLLSDGKPNDVDEYEGRYGVEDMKKAVEEAKLQGIFPFCLTIDRHAAAYLKTVFGARQYALLPRAEALPTALLDWMRKLVAQ
ncbi:MAG TPA: VWA domain-containing protein [Pusillimonas sp.]|uniref:nitric oxide reductase activation protein NorD n=1 Tax=Pusillimonas sp. TaxID=3040095 RepID=UPI002BE84778|nr:VWA domain-containing protein [Pusillimonas sp.]HUH88124.1 VWA domain-containing protein [Pusillimonas sp.]